MFYDNYYPTPCIKCRWTMLGHLTPWKKINLNKPLRNIYPKNFRRSPRNIFRNTPWNSSSSPCMDIKWNSPLRLKKELRILTRKKYRKIQPLFVLVFSKLAAIFNFFHNDHICLSALTLSTLVAFQLLYKIVKTLRNEEFK